MEEETGLLSLRFFVLLDIIVATIGLVIATGSVTLSISIGIFCLTIVYPLVTICAHLQKIREALATRSDSKSDDTVTHL